MKFNFRQGIQHAPMTSGSPSFLTYNAGNDTITIAVGVDLVRATASWHDINYLIEERENVIDVWGPFENSSTYYLFWDINLASGALTHGFTSIEPGFGVSQPLNPSTDQHWFDTTVNVMKVWSGTQWNQKIRVFAASYSGGSNVITEYQIGTQVGIIGGSTQATWFDHGYILYGIDQKAIKNSDGSMVTTAVPLNTYHGSFSSPIRLELSNSLSLADEPIPAFSAVMAVGNGTIKLASGTNPEKRPIGITTVPVMTGDPVDIVFKGIVYNDQWNWDYALGKDLYCGSTGILFQDSGSATSATRVGAILDPKTVLIDIDLFGSGGGGITWPLLAPSEYNSPNVIPFSFEDSPETGIQLKKSIVLPFDPYKWILTYGEISPGENNNDEVFAESVAYDSLGNVYAVGSDGNNESTLSFVVKHDSSGNMVWQYRFDEKYSHIAESIKIDTLDNIFIGLTYSANAYNGLTKTPVLVKMDTDGALIWQCQVEPKYTDLELHGISVDNTGNSIICASFLVGSSYQTTIHKIDSSGVVLWEKDLNAISESFGAFSPSIIGSSVATDTTGNIYVSGSVDLIWDALGQSTKSRFLSKLTSNGALQWSKIGKPTLGGLNVFTELTGNDLAINSTGIYQVSSIDNNSGYYSGVLTKYDFDGSIVWEIETFQSNFQSIALDSLGNSYISNGTSEIVIQKYNNLGEFQWARVISEPNNSTHQWYSYAYGAVAVFNDDRIAICGYTYAIELPGYSGYAPARAIIIQMGTDGSRIDSYGPMIVNIDQTDQVFFNYQEKTITFTEPVELVDVTDLDLVTIQSVDTPPSSIPGNLTFGVNRIYNSVKVPTTPIPVGDELLFSRESNVTLKLTTINGEEVVQVDTPQHGLRLSPSIASSELRNYNFVDELLTGTLRTTKGQLQSKIELNVGNNPFAVEIDGAVGYQAISSYQTVIYGPDLVGNNLVLDYGQSNSILWYVDPLNHNGSLVINNGLSGGQYELIYKFANPDPGISAFYRYPQTGDYGFLGPIVIFANMGLRNITCFGLSDTDTNVSQTILVTGRPKQIVLSNNAIDYYSGDSLDTAFVSTRGNRIEMLGANDQGSRIFGNIGDNWNQGRELALSPSINSVNEMDGYMWMNPNTNHLFAVGLAGDIWEVDSTIADPVEINHILMPSTVKVLSVNGDSTLNVLFILHTNNGVLTLCTVNCDTLEMYYRTIVSEFVDTVHEIIVDESIEGSTYSPKAIVSSSDGTNVHFVAFSTTDNSAATIINDQVIQLLPTTIPASMNMSPRKAEGTIRDGKVYIPHSDQILIIDSVTWSVTKLSINSPGPITDRLIYDPVAKFIFGTSSYYPPSAKGTDFTGTIRLHTNDLTIDANTQNSYTYATLGVPGIIAGSVSTYADLGSLSASAGIIYTTLDTGFSYMYSGTSWLDLDNSVYYSHPANLTVDKDDINIFNVVDNYSYKTLTIDPRVKVTFTDNVIYYPDNGVPVDGSWETVFKLPTSFNQTLIMKLSKSAFYDDLNHDRINHWYCTAISGPYTRPSGYSGYTG